MFSPESRQSLTCAAYAATALVVDGASRAISLPNQAGNEFLISYGHDILFPVQSYFVLRASWLNNIHKDRFNWVESVGAAATVFGAASFCELLQKVGFYEGTYDSSDFIAYGVGVGLAVTLDAITFRKTNHP
ncbi:hypothetical protein HY384_00620 [Candidatus Daviesbacteria bacterium]|nr:hypothetical protein [Candidatus Daviesbacteria bacterium]